MKVNPELMRNLAASQADNDATQIAAEIQSLGVRFGWAPEELIAVAGLCADSRKKAITGFMESFEVVIDDMLSGGRK